MGTAEVTKLTEEYQGTGGIETHSVSTESKCAGREVVETAAAKIVQHVRERRNDIGKA